MTAPTGAARSGSGARPARRLPALLVLAGLVLAAAVADRSAPGVPAHAAPAPARQRLQPGAAPGSALASAWYCPLATTAAGSAARGLLVLANSGDTELGANVTVMPVQGKAASRAVRLPPRAQVAVGLAEIVTTTADAPWVAALVEIDGGQAAAEEAVFGPSGITLTPCASSASDHWYFAEGSTGRDDTLLLGLFDPFPDDAIVDLSFTTDQGRAEPADFKGLVVPGRGLLVVDVGQHVRRRDLVSTTVAARSGRIVASRLQVRGGAPALGTTLDLGAPSAGTSWYFPDGATGDGIVERYQLYNPSDRESQAQLSLVLDQGEAEPFHLTVPPQGTVGVVTSAEPRVPKGVPHGAVVAVTNGVPLVAERVVTATAPAPRHGLLDVLGARAPARRWLLALGATNPATDEWVVVLNPGPDRATFSVQALAAGQLLAVEGLQGLQVGPGQRRAVRLGDHIRRDDLALVVSSDRPVVVERDLYTGGGSGMVASIAEVG